MTSFVRTLVCITLVIQGFAVQSQEKRTMSLEDALTHALQNNYELRQQQYDIDIATAKVRETTAIGLPQVKAEGALNYYIDIPTQVAEASTFDPTAPPDILVPLQFGLPYSSSAGITASQLIFDGSYFVGLRAAKAYVENTRLGHEKAGIEVRNGVTQTYFSVVAMDETLESLKSDLSSIAKTADDTKALYENGFVSKTDADQVRLLRSNLDYQIDATERQRHQLLQLLKFQIGMPVDEELILTTSMDELLAANSDATLLMEKAINVQDHIDHKLITQGLELTELSLSNERARYYPQLSAFFTHSQNGFSKEFGDLFTNEYYPTTIGGLQLNVPLFSSGLRYYKNKQARLELEKVMVQKQQVEQNLIMQAVTSRENFMSALERHQLMKDDLSLAEEIKRSTSVKFKEGVAGSQELYTVQSQYLQTLRNYINTSLELLNAKLAYEKALGTI